MFEAEYLKFSVLSRSNFARFLLLNLLLLVPLGCLGYSLATIVPVLARRVEPLSVSIPHVYTDQRLTVALVHDRDSGGVYVFEPGTFNRVRGALFESVRDPDAARVLEEHSIGFHKGMVYGEQFTVSSGNGRPLLDLYAEDGQDQSVEILFLDPSDRRAGPGLLSWILLAAGFLLLFGSLGGVSDYTQRIVFHETRGIGYFFRAVVSHFPRSLLVSLFLILVTGAIGVNIYFYIFVMSSDLSAFIAALNFWMLVFFVFILFWVFSLLVLNRDESVWRIMRKSLFISFDNFDFTIRSVLRTLLLLVVSCFTLFMFPGLAGVFSLNNAALKELSGKYTD